MVAWAKANPGKLTLATTARAASRTSPFENLANDGRVHLPAHPVQGRGADRDDVIGGQVQLGIGAYTSLSPHVISGECAS